MPVASSGYVDDAGRPDPNTLTRFGAGLKLTVWALAPGIGPHPEELTHELIDTGAAESCTNNVLARRVKMRVIDEMTIWRGRDSQTHPVYMARVRITQLELAQFGAFIGLDFEGAELPHQVLLGRTFLEGAVVIYDGILRHVTVATRVVKSRRRSWEPGKGMPDPDAKLARRAEVRAASPRSGRRSRSTSQSANANVELWSPANVLFCPADYSTATGESERPKALYEILE